MTPAGKVPAPTELAQHFYAAQHPSTYTWVEQEVRLALLAEQRAIDVLLAADLTVAEQRAQRFAPGHPPEDLLNRWAEVGDGVHAMLSMRYEGLDATRPFVDATVLSTPLRAETVEGLVHAAGSVFGSLQPRYVRAWSSEPTGRLPGAGPDKRFLAAPLSRLRTATTPPSELAVHPASDARHYEDARAAYDAVDRAHPAHHEQAELQSAESMAEIADEGGLYDVLVGDSWAGYVALSTGEETLGLPAYVVHEVVLAERFRGRGYGRFLWTLVSRALPADDAEQCLLGTIHQDNRGAIAAALAGGRIDVGGWVRLPLEAVGRA